MRRLRRGRVPRLVLLAGIGVIATAGVAVGGTLAVQSFTDSQGVYHGCVGNAGQLRVVTPDASCKANETAIDWNRTGPQGAKGDTGAQGPTGATGPQGPAGPAFAGSPCTLPSGTAGTVQTTVAAGGAMSFTCATTSGNPGGDGGGGGTNLCPSPLPPYPNGTAVCDGSTGTVYYTCNFGWADANGNPADGCEYRTVTPQPEVCNGIDDDLDGQVDDNLTDVPSLPHATPACRPSQGGYVIQACDPGWQDANGIVADGCEQQV